MIFDFMLGENHGHILPLILYQFKKVERADGFE